MSENTEYHWDEFADWCADHGYNIDDPIVIKTLWECWKTAIDTLKQYQNLKD